MATAQAGDGESYPLAAQIPLKEFVLPDFPPQASRLRELTLTADIKLDEYQSLLQEKPLTQPELPNVPKSVTHLTLELFGLGFPGTPAFLGRLAKCLPNLQSLTFFSCLIDGLDDSSRKDAERLFETCTQLQEIHIIDSFARPGFFKSVGSILEKRARENASKSKKKADNDALGLTEEENQGGLKVIDVSYTFRGHEDSDFLARVAGEELSSLIVPGLMGLSFDFVPVPRRDELEEEEQSSEENKKMPEGVLPFASDGRAPTAIKKRFENLSAGGGGGGGDLTSIKVLNLGMFSLRPAEVGEIVYACAGGGGDRQAGLVDLTVAVLLEDGWTDSLVAGFGHKEVGKTLEGIEIIGVPDNDDKSEEEAAATSQDDQSHHDIKLIEQADIEKLEKACPNLGKVGMSILKVRSAPNVVFLKEDDGWRSM
ncbi:uncharacterized protein PV06_03366 [Exophiala oligosperma]|uniref:Uncharacterized protein n=1 Tax=Exophiala oligosperma TaxID=215243 RepID=A0A0D2C573_9EURO|nr:uncharacterized protein PV06_03366 [Exophiala oligosperma]KIW44932.1 hypothetical protein PV06_03366 [Exophiala oligosperma]